MSDPAQAVVLANPRADENEADGWVTCIVTDETPLSLQKFTKTIRKTTTVSGLYDEVTTLGGIASGTFLLSYLRKSDQEASETVLDDKSSTQLWDIVSSTSKRFLVSIKPRDGQVPVLSETAVKSDDSGALRDGSWKAMSENNNTTSGSAATLTQVPPPSYSSVANRATTRGDHAGLVNQAMTCYLNSVLQTQFMTPEFRNAIYNWQFLGGPDAAEKSIPFQLQKLFATMQTSQKRAVKTVDVTKSFGWTNADAWQQHDVQELCRVMFDALEKNFKGTAQDQLIKQLYEGTMQDYVKCLKCHYESTRSDTYMDISLVIKPFGSAKACGSVEEALRVHVTPETLNESNQYFCEKCNSKQDAHKGLKFLTFPYLLTLQLKRFDFDYNTMHRIKLNDRMTFPSSLNLNGFIAKQGNECEVVRRQSISLGTPVDSGKHFPRRPETSTSGAGAGTPAGLCSVSGDAAAAANDAAAAASTGPSASVAAGPDVGAAAAAAPVYGEETGDDDEPNYTYELLSIMVHSGSAIGGHYYAYIRSMETGKWYSFNDSNVSPITTDDIKKTFGGSTSTGTTYTSMYSSSANAYMLIYRRMDPSRNTKFMTTEEFPPHIARLVKAVEEEEEDERRQVEIERSHCRIPVFYRPTEDGQVVKKMLEAKHDVPFKEAVDIARRLHGLDIPAERCRLVKFDENYDSCECSYEDRDEEQLGHILGGIRQTYLFDLLLETRAEDEEFDVYQPNSSTLKVQEVYLEQNSVSKSVRRVRVSLSWTVEEVLKYMEKKLGFPAATTRLVVQKYAADLSMLQPGRTLNSEGFYRSAIVYAEPRFGSDAPAVFKSTDLYQVLNRHVNTVKWSVILPDLPSTDESAENQQDDVPDASKNGSTPAPLSPRVVFVEFDRRHLVSEFKQHLKQFVGGTASNQFRLFKIHGSGQETEMRLQDTMMYHSEFQLRVEYGRAVGVDEHRVNVSFFDPTDEVYMISLGEIIVAKGMSVAQMKDEVVKTCQEIAKTSPVGSDDKRHKHAVAVVDAPVEHLRLRRKNYKAPSTVLCGDLLVGREMAVYSGWEVAIQLMDAPDLFSANQTAIFVRRWKPSSHMFGPMQEISVSSTAVKATKEVLSQLSDIPVEQVEIAKAVGFFPFHYSPLEMDELNWNPKVTALDRIPISIMNDGNMLYYRDGKEQPEEVTTERRAEIERQELLRTKQLNRSTGAASYRRERALKIKTDSA